MEQSNSQTYWKKCSSCKKEIAFNAPYTLCSVSTCRGARTGFAFCSVICWDAHLGVARHRDAYAEDAQSPSRNAYLASIAHARDEMSPNPEMADPVRRLVRPGDLQKNAQAIPVETLVVVSKVKQLIRDQSQMNTSQCGIDALTHKVVEECLKAIQNAKRDGRKTVMGRDVL